VLEEKTPRLSIAPPHLREGAVRGRAGEGPASTRFHEELSDFVAAIADVPELDAMLRKPADRPARQGVRLLDDVLGGADELVRNFLLLVVEKKPRRTAARHPQGVPSRLIAAQRAPADG